MKEKYPKPTASLKTAKNDLNVEVAKGKVDFSNWYVTQSSRKTDLEKIERDNHFGCPNGLIY